ncbi:MAG: hypothetical protein R6X15_00240 [Pseudomonadota bacterium]
MSQDPYRPPTANIENFSPADIAHAEQTRKKYLNHEASVRSIGLLYYLGVAGMLAVAAAFVIDFNEAELHISAFVIAILIALAGLYFWIGKGLRSLKKNVRIVAGIMAAIGLVSFPVGTIINGYILYLLFSAKGKVVFSDTYQEMIDATPHIKYRTSLLVWFVLVLLILILLAIVLPELVQ